MTLTLLHSAGTRSVRPLWRLKEMGLPYQLRTLGYDSTYFASDAFRKINPMGKVPALYDAGTVIAASTAIVQSRCTGLATQTFRLPPDKRPNMAHICNGSISLKAFGCPILIEVVNMIRKGQFAPGPSLFEQFAPLAG
ncbi:glutathione S-transferase N-terminal domain-containing protein [uncultured Ruegeria sp.]|uniref:glutathione S-transferase N-terminal domain-containing protein n=1 Tax=uncultured Ruegeria sp. TaxID=259304 RepID=UPI002638E000|nr:glutathione S-transferase N-terminal domain-containing protein [uncultured Ruegeria sp.]